VANIFKLYGFDDYRPFAGQQNVTAGKQSMLLLFLSHFSGFLSILRDKASTGASASLRRSLLRHPRRRITEIASAAKPDHARRRRTLLAGDLSRRARLLPRAAYRILSPQLLRLHKTARLQRTPLDRSTKFLLAAVRSCLLVGFTALIAAPDTWDALEYHCPTVMWMSNNPSDFPHRHCQLIYGPWSETP